MPNELRATWAGHGNLPALVESNGAAWLADQAADARGHYAVLLRAAALHGRLRLGSSLPATHISTHQSYACIYEKEDGIS
jgi:hypothetical protein